MRFTERQSIEFTPGKVKRLRKAYDEAVANGDISFKFEGQELLTTFAHYLLEYLELRMANRKL